MNDRLRQVLLATLIAAGCNGRDYVDDPLLPEVDPARLAQPPVLEPESESAVPPVQLETAVDEASKRDYSAQVYPERATVTLADVRQWSLENNLDVRVQQFNPTLGVTALDAEIAKFEAVLKANYTYNDNSLAENLEAGNPAANNSGTLGIDFPLATGGVLNVGSLFNQADSPLLDEPWEAGFQLDLSMPIMRGFGLRANTASIVIAKMESQQVDARTLLETIRILANAEKSYWQLYAARRIMEVRERQHALAEEFREWRHPEGGHIDLMVFPGLANP